MTLDDRINKGDCVMVVRYGDDRARPVDIVWSGVAEVNSEDDVPVALGTDRQGRDIAFFRNLSVPASERDAFVDLLGHKCRQWESIDGDDPPEDIAARANDCLMGG